AIYIAEAQVERQRAEAALARGGDPEEILQLGLSRVDKALAIHPDEPEALALRGALTALTARRETAARAAADLDTAIRLNPLLQREYGPVLDQARKLSAGGL